MLARDAQGIEPLSNMPVQFDPGNINNLLVDISVPKATFSFFVVGISASDKKATKEIEIRICKPLQRLFSSPIVVQYWVDVVTKGEKVNFFNVDSTSCSFTNVGIDYLGAAYAGVDVKFDILSSVETLTIDNTKAMSPKSFKARAESMGTLFT